MMRAGETGNRPEIALGDGAYVRRWSLIGLALILVAAFQSDGYHHPDEHFQTLEFASYKLGRTPAEALPWEFQAQMRPWLQPGLYFVLLRAAEALGLSDPFHQALLLRLTTGLIFWCALSSLTGAAPLFLPGPAHARLMVRLTWLAFWTPYLAVRTSSESLSTSFTVFGVVVLAFAMLHRRSSGVLLGAGLLFGLAFEMRFAVAVVPVGLTAWGLGRRRLRLHDVGTLAAGVLPALALGAVVDRWGYGDWSFPALRYLELNLWRDVAAQRFGGMPWYGYLAMAGESLLFPLLLLAFAGTVVAWVRFPGHVLTAATAPFVLAHMAIAHKEMRFLFPMAPFAVGLLVLAASRERGWLPALEGRIARCLLSLIMVANLAALTVFMLVPTRPALGFQRYVYRNWPGRFEAILLTPDSPWRTVGLEMYFYRPRDLRLDWSPSFPEVGSTRRRVLVIGSAWQLPSIPGYACEPLYRPFPEWVQVLGSWSPALRIEGHSLHRCHRI
jgi:phosphatidylinositol glycan class B